MRAEAFRLRLARASPGSEGRHSIFENKVGPSEVTRVGVLRWSPRARATSVSLELGDLQVIIARFMPFNQNMKGLILAQSERWRRGSDMLVERESGGNSASKVAKGRVIRD